jgi:alanyl-tRNA synthetase
MLTETPFYAVSGGQVADTGIVYNDNFEIAVSEVNMKYTVSPASTCETSSPLYIKCVSVV